MADEAPIDDVPIDGAPQETDALEMTDQKRDDVEIEVPKDNDDDTGAKEADGAPDEEEDDELIFDDSTHRFLIYYNNKEHPTGGQGFPGLIIALGVIAIEWVLFGIIVAEASSLLSDNQVPVMVDFGSVCGCIGENCTRKVSETKLICESEEGNFNSLFLAFVLVAMYLMGDLIGGIKAAFTLKGMWPKIGTALVFATAVFAAYAASLFAWQGIVTNGSSYDAVVNCLGVLFVIDIDEQVMSALDNVQFADKVKEGCSCLDCKCCDGFFKVILLILCAVLFIVLGAITTATVDMGDTYDNYDSTADVSSYYAFNPGAPGFDAGNYASYDSFDQSAYSNWDFSSSIPSSGTV